MLSTAHALNGRNSESKSEVGPKKKLALSVHQHPRPQEKEVAMVAGADIKLRVYFMYHTLHRDSRQRDDNKLIE